ncbi:MAG: hypothetical protein RMM58_07255 [Chloroflexota bacterium]|nr:hypothetical protein [Dehalococcoidia bacterium]MDW8253656.1 hypothetical protein [Chloroflexota bacterium]
MSPSASAAPVSQRGGSGNAHEAIKRRPAGWQKIPWSLAEIRRLGDWGHASNHLGSAWERYAAARLLDDRRPWLLPGGERYRPLAVVPLGIDAEFGLRLSVAGQRAPDALVVGRSHRAVIIQPVDFKFSLDHAEAGQIGVEVAVAAGQLLGERFAARLEMALQHRLRGDWTERLVPGALVSPPSQSNRRARVPGRPLIRWVDAAIEEFFPPLPAAPIAAWLTELDEIGPIHDDFDLAEAYYRLGAAVAGAVGRLTRPLFAEHAATLPASLDAVEAWCRRHAIRSTAAAIERARPLLDERRAQEARLRRLLRRPASREELNAAVGQPPETPLSAWSAAALQALREAQEEDRAAVLRRGAELLASGSSEEDALALLEADYQARARQFLARLRELSR